ncbi:hypothetical protein D3C80_1414840 [compost metagenome]
MHSTFVNGLLLRGTEFPQRCCWKRLVGHWHPEVLLEHRVVEPDYADIARVAPKNEFASLAGFGVRRPDPVPQCLRVVVHIKLHTIMLHSSTVRRHEIQLDCERICRPRWDAHQRIGLTTSKESEMPFTRRAHVNRGVVVVVVEDNGPHQPFFKLTHREDRVLV